MCARMLISQHPEVEAEVTAELDALGLLVTPERPQPAQPEFGDLSKLTYLSAAIKVHVSGASRFLAKHLQAEKLGALALHETYVDQCLPSQFEGFMPS